MRLGLALFGFVLAAFAANAKDYPEFSGVYIGYNDTFVKAEPIPGYFSYVYPSTAPLEDPRFRPAFINRGKYRVGNREIYGRTALIMRTYRGEDFARGVVANVWFNRSKEFSILVVGRPETRVGERFNHLVGFDDFAAVLQPLTPQQKRKCADYAARGMAPLAGGFDECKAGGFGHDAEGTNLVNAAWGYGFDDIFQEKIISQTTTEYVLKPGISLCPSSDTSADAYGNLVLKPQGWTFKLNDGRAFAVACGVHITNMNESLGGSIPFWDVLEPRMAATCEEFGTSARCR